MDPKKTTAASFVPSLLDVIDLQLLAPAPVWAVQVTPESREVQMDPPFPTTAASFVPSLLDVSDDQLRSPVLVCSIQVTPESVEV